MPLTDAQRQAIRDEELFRDEVRRELTALGGKQAPPGLLARISSFFESKTGFWLLTTVLAAIAAISLLVGGVGVSNIMLVSVRERTREIGLRKAVGARQRDVLLQFLIEAVLLTSIGGVLGIALGVGGALGLSAAIDSLPAVITWQSPVLAFGVSAAVGLFFGVVPARRAGRLDPVVALRSE